LHQVEVISSVERGVGEPGQELELRASPRLPFGEPDAHDRLRDLGGDGLEEHDVSIVEGVVEADAQDPQAGCVVQQWDGDEPGGRPRHVAQRREPLHGVASGCADDGALLAGRRRPREIVVEGHRHEAGGCFWGQPSMCREVQDITVEIGEPQAA
jgi:hypothetical protein